MELPFYPSFVVLGLKKVSENCVFFEKKFKEKFKKIQKKLMKLVMKQSELEKNRESQLFRQVFKTSTVLSPNKGIIHLSKSGIFISKGKSKIKGII